MHPPMDLLSLIIQALVPFWFLTPPPPDSPKTSKTYPSPGSFDRPPSATLTKFFPYSMRVILTIIPFPPPLYARLASNEHLDHTSFWKILWPSLPKLHKAYNSWMDYIWAIATIISLGLKPSPLSNAPYMTQVCSKWTPGHICLPHATTMSSKSSTLTDTTKLCNTSKNGYYHITTLGGNAL